MPKFFAIPALVAKVFLLGCFSMGIFGGEASATPSCHETSANFEACDACEIATEAWSADFVATPNFEIFSGEIFAIFSTNFEEILSSGLDFASNLTIPDPPDNLNFSAVEIKKNVEFLI